MELQQEKDYFRLFSTAFCPISTVFRPPILIVRKEVFAPYIECLRNEKYNSYGVNFWQKSLVYQEGISRTILWKFFFLAYSIVQNQQL